MSAGSLPPFNAMSLSLKDLEGGERAIGDCTFQQQAVLVIGQQLQALDLMALDRTLPAQESRSVIELALENVFARIISAAGRIRDRDCHQLTADDWFDENGT